MSVCRVCRNTIDALDLDAPAPALTSIMTLLDVPTRVFVCDRCGHAQSDDIPDIQDFYDHVYRISLAGDDHDQVFAVESDGSVIYRTDHQADIALRLLDIPHAARVLDYGAAKSDTLRKIYAARPDIQPHVFDVSTDYAAAWNGWVPEAAQATYAIPDAWLGTFEVIMSYFVIEHVPDPVAFVCNIASLLRPGGSVLLAMPNVDANPGDMAVADHLNHFSEASLRRLLADAGLTVGRLDKTAFPGAFFVMAARSDDAPHDVPAPLVEGAVRRAREICTLWDDASVDLAQQVEEFAGRNAAIYGAGFYGAWIYSRIQHAVRLAAVLDRNPHLQGATQFGVSVLPPERIPDDIEVLFVGLNPLKARDAIAAQPWLQRPGLSHVWIAGA